LASGGKLKISAHEYCGARDHKGTVIHQTNIDEPPSEKVNDVPWLIENQGTIS
jgi:hypothetical protein